MLRRGPILAVVALAAAIAAVSAVAARTTSALREEAVLKPAADLTAADAALDRIAMSAGPSLAAEHCARCHGADLKGRPLRGAPNLVDRDWLYGEGRVSEIEQTLLYGVRSGHPKTRDQASMPAFGQARPYARYDVPPLTPDEIADVSAFLAAMGGRAADPAATARGQHVYRNSGGCYDCHGEDATGDTAIGAPDLTDAVWLTGDGSTASIVRSIAEGRAGECPAWQGVLRPGQIRILALYLHLRSQAAAPVHRGAP